MWPTPSDGLSGYVSLESMLAEIDTTKGFANGTLAAYKTSCQPAAV